MFPPNSKVDPKGNQLFYNIFWNLFIILKLIFNSSIITVQCYISIRWSLKYFYTFFSYQLYNGLSQPLPVTFIKYKLYSIPGITLVNRIYQFNHTWKSILIQPTNQKIIIIIILLLWGKNLFNIRLNGTIKILLGSF